MNLDRAIDAAIANGGQVTLDKVVWEYVRPVYTREGGKRYRLTISSEGYVVITILRENDTVYTEQVRLVK